MDIYREKIGEYLDIQGISDEILIDLLDDAGRDLVYNYLLFGKNVSHEDFKSNMKIVLDLIKADKGDEKLKLNNR